MEQALTARGIPSNLAAMAADLMRMTAAGYTHTVRDAVLFTDDRHDK